jgi:hypothetical protein
MTAKVQDFHFMRYPTRAWAEVWHLWTVIIPRRSITGRLLWGRVWRRHNGRHWIYKKFVEYDAL